MKKKVIRSRYISAVQTHNFKGFKENQEIEFVPKVNLIFGKNSTGKSSIFQTIRLFRQSLRYSILFSVGIIIENIIFCLPNNIFFYFQLSY